jgi:hypothetical protein
MYYIFSIASVTSKPERFLSRSESNGIRFTSNVPAFKIILVFEIKTITRVLICFCVKNQFSNYIVHVRFSGTSIRIKYILIHRTQLCDFRSVSNNL